MATIRCPLDLNMHGSPDVDVLLLQWHTPNEAAAAHVHPPSVVARRAGELEQLAAWLDSPTIGEVNRPIFLIAPELSFPRSLLPRVEAIVSASQRPIVFISGLEYMSVEDFDALMTTATADMIVPPGDEIGWLDNRQGERFVNCAAIITNRRYGGGEVTRHYQVKRHPYIGEQSFLAVGRHILLFSEAQTSGPEPLDFAVQICSDFVNEAAVAAFRESLAEDQNRTRLDFLFVLQWNPDQRAWAFAQRLDEFYSAESRMICGAQTAVLFVNNAAPTHWRAEQLGGSCLMVQKSASFRGPARNPATAYYERPPGPPNSFQVLVFREDGPSFQHLEALRPLRSVRPAPGQGNEYPVKKASCARLQGSDETLQFHEFSATCRWLADEWHLDVPRLTRLCLDADGKPDEALARFMRRALTTHAAQWTRTYLFWEMAARDFVQDFAFAIAEAACSCPRSERLEPNYWDQFFVRAVRKQLLTAVLLQLAEEASSRSLQLSRRRMCHATLDDEVSLSFHWGNREYDADHFARMLRSNTEMAIANLAYHRHVFVFIETTGEPDEAESELNEDVDETGSELNDGVNLDVTRAGSSLLNSWDNGPVVGNVADATPRFGVIVADKFMNKLSSCRQPDDIRSLARLALDRALTA